VKDGIECPICKGQSTKVLDGRPAVREDHYVYRRRRVCKHEHRFTTIEILESDLKELLDLSKAVKSVLERST